MARAPTNPNHRVPYLSAKYPHKTPKKAEEKEATVYAREVSPRDQPKSEDMGFKKTDIEAKDPKASPLKTKTTKTITHAYLGVVDSKKSSVLAIFRVC